MSAPVEVHRVARDGTYATVGNVLVSVFWDRPDVAALRQREPIMERLVATYPTGTAMLSVLASDGDQTLPGADTRRELERQAARFRSTFRGAVVALEAKSIYITLLRPFLRAVASFSRVPYAFTDTTADAIAWLMPKVEALPGAPTAQELGAVLDRIRRQGGR